RTGSRGQSSMALFARIDLANSLVFQLLLGLGFGVFFGVMPLTLGLALRRPALAWRGFAASIFCGLIGGLCCRVPIAMTFALLIGVRGGAPRRRWPVDRDDARYTDQRPRAD